MKLNIVVPCYNEEAVLQETTKQLSALIDALIEKGKIAACDIVYVDDGSHDTTWTLIEQLQTENKYVHGLKLAHNVGHQNALWAGMEWSDGKCDAMVSIDADLQHDIRKIEDMVDAYHKGYEVVYGIRNSRKTDSVFKKRTALGFYNLMRKMGVDIIPNHADFRLLGSKALHALMQYPERNMFLRGMVRLIGFPSTEVYFDVHERFAGESKYTLSKMLNFAADGITSFSVQPLRIISVIGMLCVLLSLAEMVYILIAWLRGSVVAGWSSLLFSVWFLGGLLLLSVGIIGEYIGKIYKEVKQRPRYIIEKNI
ncbi:MAG: glycosyltransferase family 2 protein [Paludibacteraceae bacterium]|nr:glycosyltransferase family 2 protein [Paludibacteraceae bacterium]